MSLLFYSEDRIADYFLEIDLMLFFIVFCMIHGFLWFIQMWFISWCEAGLEEKASISWLRKLHEYGGEPSITLMFSYVEMFFFFYSFLLRSHFVILKLTTIFDKGCGRWKFSTWLQSAERSSGIIIADSNWHLFSNTYSFNPTQSFSHNISVSSYNMFLLHICNFLCFCYDFWVTNKLQSEHDVY